MYGNTFSGMLTIHITLIHSRAQHNIYIAL